MPHQLLLTSLFGILIALFITCQSERPELPADFHQHTVILAQTYPPEQFAVVTIFLPPSYDTLLQWVDRSDCGGCCNVVKYRFTNSRSCLLQESGFLKSRFCPDTFAINQLTIQHQDLDCGTVPIDTALLRAALEAQSREDEIFKFAAQWKRREIRRIGGYDFLLEELTAYSKRLDRPTHQLSAMTFVTGACVSFIWECEPDDFAGPMDDAYAMLYSIRIDTL
jgi:hypothetical protein